jgi:hypothetical protein
MNELITYNQIVEISDLSRPLILRRIKRAGDIEPKLIKDGEFTPKKAITIEEYQRILIMGRRVHTRKTENDPRYSERNLSFDPGGNREKGLYMRILPYWWCETFKGKTKL